VKRKNAFTHSHIAILEMASVAGARKQYDIICKERRADIVVCEGTKSAAAAQQLLPGYVCTTPLFGAQSPEYSDWDAVKGRNVIIWPDNDETGDSFAQLVKKYTLIAGAKSVSVLFPPKDKPEKWDAADALAEGWTDEKAAIFVQGQRTSKGLKKMTLGELLAKDIKERQMILDPIISEKSAVMIHAYRGIGKTHVALGIAHAIATGSTFLKWSAPQPRRVLIVDGEMPEYTLQERLKALVKATGKKPPQDDYFQLIARDFQDEPMPSLSTPEGQALINQCLEGVDLLVLDNISTLCPGLKENDADDWSSMQNWLLELRSRNIAVLIVHHSGKGGAQRGTSRREDIMDTVMMLDRPEGYNSRDGARFRVTYEKARGIYGDDAEPFEAELETAGNRAVWHVIPIVDGLNERIIALAKEGKSVRDIAAETGIPASTIQHRLRKIKTQGKL
jgi:hypothetical protein